MPPVPHLPATPELLAPAGNMECARAAVANGADAIYFGLPRFNARLRADNFTEKELPDLMQFLHAHGVRGFVTMNTLIFTSELADAEAQLRLLEAAGVDAIIVQDVGLVTLAHRVAPKLEVHASTQMTITSPESLTFLSRLGLDRAVLARECSLRELEAFKNKGARKSGSQEVTPSGMVQPVPPLPDSLTPALPDSPTVPLEVFVHGALCVAYSGQCLTSESLGQRSANRGECAQACRMPYDLVVDGEVRDLGDRRYLLSPQDLAAVEEIPRLIELGVASFKIEGRLKSPEYVAAVTKVYRKAIDAAKATAPVTQPVPAAVPQCFQPAPNNEPSPTPPSSTTKEDRYELEMTFSRGLFSGWMHGVDHQQLVGARFGKKRGALVGRVRDVGWDFVELDHAGAWLKAGDGVVFDNGGDTDREQGGRVYEMDGTRLAFQRGKIDFSLIKAGDRVWKTSDQALDSRLRATFSGDILPRQTVGLRLTVSGKAGDPLSIHEETTGVEILSAMPLQTALKRPLTEESLRDQLSRLGGTRFFLEAVRTELDGEVIVPVSELNRMRRALVEAVGQERSAAVALAQPCSPLPANTPSESERGSVESRGVQAPELTILCRSVEQLQTCAAAGVLRAYLDLEDVRKYADAVAYVREHSAMEVFLATPRIQKANEQGFFKLIERANPHGVLVRNTGAIAHFEALGIPMMGDFSLNVANPLTARWYLEQARMLEGLTISYDLNVAQVLDLLHAAPPGWFELTVHQHMPMFHMEHCVFAAFMSTGSTFLDCGRPCEKHSVKLRDRVGMEHPLKADVGCRNTLFNARAQTGARYYADLHAAGLRRWRVELLEENAAEVRRILTAYRGLLSGAQNGEELWRDLKAQSQLGVTGGTLQAV